MTTGSRSVLSYCGSFKVETQMNKYQLKKFVTSVSSEIKSFELEKANIEISNDKFMFWKWKADETDQPKQVVKLDIKAIPVYIRRLKEITVEGPIEKYFALLCHNESSHFIHIFVGIVETIDDLFEELRKAKRLLTTDEESKLMISSMNISYKVYWNMLENNENGQEISVVRSRSAFKTRKNKQKKVVIRIVPSQDASECPIDFIGFSAFYIGISKEKVNENKCYDLEEIKFGPDPTNANSYELSGLWKLCDLTPEDVKMLTDENGVITLVFELMTSSFQQPARFVIHHGIKLYPENEKFWIVDNPKLKFDFSIKLKECDPDVDDEFQLMGIYQIDDSSKSNLVAFANYIFQNKYVITKKIVNETLIDANLVTGTGEVIETVSENLMTEWYEVIQRWKSSKTPPSRLKVLMKDNIPNELRRVVWMLIAEIYDENPYKKTYEDLLKIPSEHESMIKKDISRTFPLHPFFRQAGSAGQNGLFNVCKAYSLYDPEVGFIQGMSFIAAVFLIHLNEADAFAMMIYVMYNLNHRENFIDCFSILQAKFFAFNKLLFFFNPELGRKLEESTLTPHMYLTNWILALFASKFSLNFVYYIFDLYLWKGEIIIYKTSLALFLENESRLGSYFDDNYFYMCSLLQKEYLSHRQVQSLIKKIFSLNLVTPELILEYLEQYKDIQHFKKDEEELDVAEVIKVRAQVALESAARIDLQYTKMSRELELSKIALLEIKNMYREKMIFKESECENLKKSVDNLNEMIGIQKNSRDLEISQLKEELHQSQASVLKLTKMLEERSQDLVALNVQKESILHIVNRQQESIDNIINNCTRCRLRYSKEHKNEQDSSRRSDQKRTSFLSELQDIVEPDIEDLKVELLNVKEKLAESLSINEVIQAENKKLKGSSTSTSISNWFSKLPQI